MLQNVYFSTSEVQEGRCKKDSHCRLEHICDFYQPSWSFEEDIPFLVVDSTKISQINTSLHQITCQMLTFMFSLIVPEEMAYIIIFWAKFYLL